MPRTKHENGSTRARGQRSSSSVCPLPLGRNVSLSSMTSEQQRIDGFGNGEGDVVVGTEPTVMYFACKNETFHLRKNYKRFLRILKSHLTCTVIPLDQDLGEGLLAFCNLVILAGLNVPLTEHELGLLFEYVQNGGSVLVLGESMSSPSFYNDFTQHFGILLMEDVVISVIRKKQYHPKECFVASAIICPTLFLHGSGLEDEDNLDIVYPHGCSLNIQTCLAAPIISSGSSSYPCSRPLGAIYYNLESKGRVIVFGSGHTFTDEFIGLENNKKLLEILLDVLVTEQELELVVRDSELMEHEDFYCTGKKAGRLRGALQDIDEYIFPGCVNPIMNGAAKPMSLMACNIGRLDYSLQNDVFNAYDLLQVERVPLPQSVQPQFETPLFTPKLAVFPPTFREIPPPPLELFDIDEELSPIDNRLGRLLNKCTSEEDDLEFFIESIGDLLEVKGQDHADSGELGVKNQRYEDPKTRCKSILHAMMTQLVNFKISNVPCIESDSDTLSIASGMSMIDNKYFDSIQEDENSMSQETN